MTEKVYGTIHSNDGVINMATDNARAKASNKYSKENCKRYGFEFNKKTDSDVIEKLDNVKSKAGYIKELIRNDLNGLTLPLEKVFQLIEFINDNTLNCYSYSERTLTFEMKDVNQRVLLGDDISWESFIIDVIGLNVNITYGNGNFVTLEFN